MLFSDLIRCNDIRCNNYIAKKINPEPGAPDAADPPAAATVRSQGAPGARDAPHARVHPAAPAVSSPSGVIRVQTVRRSLLSRQREINARFSSRSSSRVISESRVTMRLPISPHGKSLRGAAQNPQHVVLRRGKILGLQHLRKPVRQSLHRPHHLKVHHLLRAGARLWLQLDLCGSFHIPTILVTTTIVNRIFTV